MKTRTITNVLAGLALVVGSSHADPEVPIPEQPQWDRASPEAYGLQLATYADRYDEGWMDSFNSSQMTLFDAQGDSVQRKTTQMILEGGDEGDKSIIRFLSPADIKGVAAMTHEHPEATDDSWLYLPASKRVRRISGANKTASFQGTEFTYEDLSNLIVQKYDWRFLEEVELPSGDETVRAFKLEARPNYKNTGYAFIHVYYNVENWRREKIDFFDAAKKPLKTLQASEWKLYHDRFWRPLRLEMSNHQTRKRTLLEITTQLVDLSRYTSKKTGMPRANLTDEQFTQRALER